MLKAVIIDANAVSRGLLNSVLTEGGHSVVGQTHAPSQGLALLHKFRPHVVCVALEQMEDPFDILAQIQEQLPKTLVFMVSGAIDQATLEASVARGVHGFIVKPFKADAVLKTIKNGVLAMIRRQQDAGG